MRDRKSPDRKVDAQIDWEEIRGRVEKARTVIEQGWTPGPDDEKKILRQRAKVLAMEQEEEQAEGELEIVEFLLAQERYGIDTSRVREVCPLKDLTPVPCTPAFVLGIINLRGQIISVIDLKKFFDLPEKGLGDLNKVIILQSESMEFGVLADVVLGVRKISVDELQASLPTFTGIREEYLLGIGRDRTVVLDAERLLGDNRLIVSEEI